MDTQRDAGHQGRSCQPWTGRSMSQRADGAAGLDEQDLVDDLGAGTLTMCWGSGPEVHGGYAMVIDDVVMVSVHAADLLQCPDAEPPREPMCRRPATTRLSNAGTLPKPPSMVFVARVPAGHVSAGKPSDSFNAWAVVRGVEAEAEVQAGQLHVLAGGEPCPRRGARSETENS